MLIKGWPSQNKILHNVKPSRDVCTLKKTNFYISFYVAHCSPAVGDCIFSIVIALEYRQASLR